MKRVVERCPTCGVEHEDYAAEGCEACGTALRYWCRAHSREAGWLQTPECRRCAEEAARPTPPPRPRAAPPVRPASAPARPTARARAPAAPPRSLPHMVPRGTAAGDHDDERLAHDTPQTVLSNIILALLAGVVAGGFLAFGAGHPKAVLGVVVVLAMAGFVAGAIFHMAESSAGPDA